MPPNTEEPRNADLGASDPKSTISDRRTPLASNEHPASPGHTWATILLVSPYAEDHEFFSSIFDLPHWKIYWGRSCREALNWMARDRMSVIISESSLPDGNWKDILSQAQVLPNPPCVVVASRLADDLLWAEVLNLGGYDVLAKPFVREEVIRVAELASLNWKREVEDKASALSRRSNAAP